MRRIRLVLAVAAVMVAMLAAFAGPAMSADWNNRGDDGWRWDNRGDDGWRWNNWNNWPFFANKCEWEFEEGWFLTFWGWQWGAWVLDC